MQLITKSNSHNSRNSTQLKASEHNQPNSTVESNLTL